MIIPKKLKVGGHAYEVEKKYAFKERSDRCGQSDHALMKILISEVTGGGAKRARSDIEQTFIHEAFHCIDSVYNAAALSEEQIERLSQGLYQVLTDNKMLR